jgi:hypothetical protein
MLICFISTNVYASSLNKDETEYYFTRYFSDSKYSEKLYLYKMDGNVVYCVEPGVTPGTTDYNPTAIEYLNLPHKVLENITYYAYFGYDYPGHQNIKYYAAAQGLMWEDILGLVSPTTISTEPFNKGTQIDISNERNEILSLINTYKTFPSFKGKTFQYVVGEEATLVDTNGVLNNFEVDELLNANGNTITFKFDKASSWTFRFKRKKVYEDNYQLYHSDTHQDMLKAGSIPETVASRFSIKYAFASMNIKKVDDEGNPLKDVQFDIYDEEDDFIKSFITNEDGLISTGNMFSYGNYYFKEHEAPVGYQPVTVKYPFSISGDNQGFTITIVNKKIVNSIKFIKYIRNQTGDKEIEVGAKFNLLDDEGNILKEYVTNEDGSFYDSFSYGKYKLVQTYGKEGYKYIDDYEFEVNDMKPLQTIELFDDEIIKEDESIEIDEDIIIEDDEEVLYLEDVPYTYKSDMSIFGIVNIIFGFVFYILEVKNEE